MKLLPICAAAMLPFSLNPFLVGFSYLSRMVFLQALPWAFFSKNEVDVLLAIRDTQKLSSSTFEKLALAKKKLKFSLQLSFVYFRYTKGWGISRRKIGWHFLVKVTWDTWWPVGMERGTNCDMWQQALFLLYVSCSVKVIMSSWFWG